jgi:radical SAM superfamily enzyme YgiQ (UPF0313 family)
MNKKELVFLVSPYTSFEIDKSKQKKFNRAAPLSFPLGVLNLSSTVKFSLDDYNDDNVKLIDFNYYNRGTSYEEIIEGGFRKEITGYDTIDKGEDYIFAITLMFSCSWEPFIVVVNFLRKRFPLCTIVVGGVHATYAYKYILENTSVDYLIRGEGENSLPELLKNIGNNKKITEIKGVYDKDKALNAQAKITDHLSNIAENSEILDVNDTPEPDYDILRGKDEYFDYKSHVSTNTGPEYQNRRWAQLITSRGCPFNCPYCAATAFSGKAVRYKSSEHLISEINYLYENFNVTGFIPEDDFFIGPTKRMQELLEAFKKTKVPDMKITFRNGVNVNTITDEKLDILVEMGVDSVSIAIESGSPYTQKHILKKMVNLDKAPTVIDQFKENGVEVKTFIMIGLPRETDELIEETISYAEKLNTDWCNVYLFFPIIGTAFYDEMLAAQQIDDGPDTWNNLSPFSRDFDHMGKTSLEWEHILMEADLRINYANNTNLLKGDYQRAFIYFNIIRKHSPESIFARICALLCAEKLKMFDEASVLKNEIGTLVNDENVYNYYLKFEDVLMQNNIFEEYKLSSFGAMGFPEKFDKVLEKQYLVRDI